jgi:hypothetical protein
MRTITEQTKLIIKDSSYLEEGLALGIINLSALARRIKPQIEAQSLKKTSLGAVVMALQRTGKGLKKKSEQRKIILPNDLTVRSNLGELTYQNSNNFRQVHPKILKLAENKKDVFFNVTQGVFETSIIASLPLLEDIKQLLKNEKLLIGLSNLSSITLRFPNESLYVPGVYYFILKNLAWEGVNVVEVISIHCELSIIVDQSKMDKAFSVIKNLIQK